MATITYPITWDKTTERLYETGTKNGVLYPYDSNATDPKKVYGPGVPWNGLTAVTESPDGAEETALYADDIKYLSLRSAEEFGFTIEAYMYPDAWSECDGTANLGGISGVVVAQQKRKMFGFCYTSVVGNDVDGNDFAEKIHLIYAATASPSERSYETINDSPDAITFSWECTTTPIDIPNLKKSALITIDTSKLDEQGKANLTKLKEKLYGTSGTEGTAYLPLPEEVMSIMSEGASG